LENERINFNKCRIKDFFINAIFKDPNFDYFKEENQASFVEITMNYIIENGFLKLRKHFDEISLAADGIMVAYLKNNEMIISQVNNNIFQDFLHPHYQTFNNCNIRNINSIIFFN
jgi:hypothetical protein